MATALLVEDDETQIEYFSALLKRAGYEVTVAGDGMEALSLCQTQRFDLLVTDVRMPRLSGISFLRNAIKFAPSMPPRIVVVTSLDDSIIRRDAMDAGASAFLVKPVTAIQFEDAISGRPV